MAKEVARVILIVTTFLLSTTVIKAPSYIAKADISQAKLFEQSTAGSTHRDTDATVGDQRWFLSIDDRLFDECTFQPDFFDMKNFSSSVTQS